MNHQEQIDSWEDPPEQVQTTHSVGKYDEFADTLRASKGKWARMTPRDNLNQARALLGNIRRGRIAAMAPAGAFEAERDGLVLWVRYVGEPEGGDRGPTVKLDPKTSGAIREWAVATGRRKSHRGRISHELAAEWKEATKGGTH